jgi:integrase
LTLRIQWQGADYQDRNCQQPVHNALVALPSSATIIAPTEFRRALEILFYRR